MLGFAAEMRDLSSPIGTFIRERCIVGPADQAAPEDIFAAWVSCGTENEREHSGNKQVFCRDLRSALPQLVLRQPREGGGRYRVYEGIGLAE